MYLWYWVRVFQTMILVDIISFIYWIFANKTNDYSTIQKKQICSRQKSPETWSCLPNPIFFCWFQIGWLQSCKFNGLRLYYKFHFSSRLLLIFFWSFPNCCFYQFITKLNKNVGLLKSVFLFSSADAEQNLLKMKNGFHLETVEITKFQ